MAVLFHYKLLFHFILFKPFTYVSHFIISSFITLCNNTVCLKDATRKTCLALNGEIWVLHAFHGQPQVKHIHNTINWPTEDMSHNVWSRFTTRIHVLRHLHWWLILHRLSKVTLWYYITPSAVIVEELNLVEASDANTHKWLQMSKLALTSSLPEATQMPRKSGKRQPKITASGTH